jgi:hypothetical protein
MSGSPFLRGSNYVMRINIVFVSPHDYKNGNTLDSGSMSLRRGLRVKARNDDRAWRYSSFHIRLDSPFV